MLYIIDIFGTFVFAVSGAFRAMKYELDILGVLVLSVATGVGGGIIRDVLIGYTPPAVLRDETYILICCAGGLLVFLAARKIAYRWDYVMLADALGLGVFAAIGAAKASQYGLGFIGIIIMAAMTATGGGVIRDVLVREIPAVLKTDFYAMAAMIGGACYVLAGNLGYGDNIRLLCAAAATLFLRLMAMKFRISLPKMKSLSLSPSELTLLRKIEKGGKRGKVSQDNTLYEPTDSGHNATDE